MGDSRRVTLQVAALFVEDNFGHVEEPDEVVHTPTPLPRATKLRILTLNIWGLPHADDQPKRMKALCGIFGEWDVICFQVCARVADGTH